MHAEVIAKELCPLAWYEKIAQKSHFVIDVAQRRAITVLDGLWQSIINYEHKSLLRRIGLISKAVPQSIYLWGGVGRGKSFLMNAFFNVCPLVIKNVFIFTLLWKKCIKKCGNINIIKIH